MANHDSDRVFYVKTVPEIRFVDELFHVCYKIGRGQFEFVMRPSVFAKALLLAQEAQAKWQYHSADGSNVRHIRRKK